MIMPGQFDPPSAQQVVYGERIALALPRVLKQLWAAQTVIATNTSLAAEGSLASRVADILGKTLRNTVTGVRANSPREDVIRITAALRGKGVDAIVSVGGSSVVEATKAARICLTNNVTKATELDRLKTTTTAASPRPYLIAIPTTLSGAEFTQLAGVTDERTGVKDVFYHKDLAPDVVILDPEATLATPEWLWLSTGLRALDHAVETWCAREPTPYSDATSLYAARTLSRWLPITKITPDDIDARLGCQVGAWMANQGAAVGVSHGASDGIGQAISAIAGVAHGITSCIMLPHVLRYNSQVSHDRQAVLAEAIGKPGQHLGDVVNGMVVDFGLPTRLRDAGVRHDQIPIIAKLVRVNPRVAANFRPIDTEDAINRVLEAAF